MPPTRSGVFYDLAESPLKVERNGFTFYFSSMTHMNRFMALVDDEETRFNATMSKRIGCPIDLREAADVKLYVRVETRGFRVFVHETEEFVCSPQSLAFVGPRPRTRGCEARSGATTPR